MKYDVIIGMEIHAELKTASKMFCACDNMAEGREPNTVVCPICLGHPGTLPVANKKAIEWTILIGLALNCKINHFSKFDRKNYFYPDLPKGYQISQYDLPIAHDGYVEFSDEPGQIAQVKITRIHLEEDTGKLTHPKGQNYSLADFNRAGTPLIELVTKPTIKTAGQAKKFCQLYHQTLRYLNISDADMEKGHMRCEANVSVQEKNKWEYDKNGEVRAIGDYKLNPKVEIKNINSFKAIEKAIDFEIKRQKEAIEEGEKLVQETRGWNEDQGETVSQRIKETAADYRYFPEPDIPPLRIMPEWITAISAQLVELPMKKKQRFMEQYDFIESDAEILVSDKQLADYTEKIISELRAWIEATGDDWERQKKKLSKTAANWLINELFKHLRADNKSVKDLKITAENFAELITLVYQDKINSSSAQAILEEMYKSGGDPTHIMDDKGLEQIDDEENLENVIKEIIEKNPAQVQQFKDGKENVLQFLVGQTMSATKGKANPKLVTQILRDLISK